MNIYHFLITLSAALLLFIILSKISKRKRPVIRALCSVLAGGAALAVVDICSVFTGVYLPLSFLTLSVSLAGGIPGVTLLLALNLFF